MKKVEEKQGDEVRKMKSRKEESLRMRLMNSNNKRGRTKRKEGRKYKKKLNTKTKMQSSMEETRKGRQKGTK